jgi:hypothetical protein
MAGLVLAIRAFFTRPKDVDARHKAGHDGLGVREDSVLSHRRVRTD